MMLTAAALSAYLTSHDCVPRDLVPVMTAIAMHESHGDTEAVNRNPNGTVDYGVAQVNSVHIGDFSGLTMANRFDVCVNVRAGARILMARYNGNPPDAMKAAYSADVLARIAQSTTAETTVPSGAQECPKQPDDDGWHMIAIPPRCVAADDDGDVTASTSMEPTENAADHQ